VEQGGPDVVRLLKKHQPKAMVFQGPAATIRDIGNELGVASYPCWATADPEKRDVNGDVNGPGDPNGSRWLPAECGTPFPGHTWCWLSPENPNIDPGILAMEQAERDRLGTQRPLDKLMEIYLTSVGRNCNLLLNATPDNMGLIPHAEMNAYSDFGKEIQRRFGKPVAEMTGSGPVVELALEKPGRIDHVIIMEDIRHGERVRAYEVEGLVPGNNWQKLCDGISVGHKRIQRFPPQEVAKVRLRITRSVAVPQLRRVAVFGVA
jgi:alpha-L-fucosidase